MADNRNHPGVGMLLLGGVPVGIINANTPDLYLTGPNDPKFDKERAQWTGLHCLECGCELPDSRLYANICSNCYEKIQKYGYTNA